MPAVLPHAKPDKAMTLDMQALQSLQGANAALAATPASPAQTQPPAPADSDFAEPENPWVAQERKPLQTAQPSQVAAPAPVAPPSQAALAQSPAPAKSQNPWAALQSQYAAPPSGQPQQQAADSPAAAAPAQVAPSSKASSAAAQPPLTASQSQTARPSASSAPATPPAPAVSSSATAAATPPQRQCFTNSEGVKICYMQDEQHHNTTDIHKEGGVNDYHSDVAANSKEGIQGHIPGNNVTDTLNHLSQTPSANEHKDGNTAFQGQSSANISHAHDIHKDKTTFTEHEDNAGNMDENWKSAFKGPDGSKEMSEIDKDGRFKDMSDTRIDAQGKDKLDSEEWRSSNDHKLMSDRPGTKDDSSLIWDEDQERKKQREEFQGKGVYDLHEETSSHESVKAKVDGDQGWAGFQQNMNDFDNFFRGDKEWTKKMRGPHGKRDESAIAETAEAAQMADAADIAQEADHDEGDGEAPWWWQAYVGSLKPPGAAFWTSYWPYKTKRSIDGMPNDDAVAMAAKGIDLAGLTKRDEGGKCEHWELLCDFAEWVGQRPVVGREDKRDVAAVKRDLVTARDDEGKCAGWGLFCDFVEWFTQNEIQGRVLDEKRDVEGHRPKHGGHRDNGDFEDIAANRLHDHGDAAAGIEAPILYKRGKCDHWGWFCSFIEWYTGSEMHHKYDKREVKGHHPKHDRYRYNGDSDGIASTRLHARGCLPKETRHECACRLDPATPNCGLLREIGMRDLHAVEAESWETGGPRDNGDFDDIAKTRLHDRRDACRPEETRHECACRLDPATSNCGLLRDIWKRGSESVEASFEEQGAPHDNGDFEDIAGTRLHDRGEATEVELETRQLVDPVSSDQVALWSFACCGDDAFVPYTKPCRCDEKPEAGLDGITKESHASDRKGPSTGHRRSIEDTFWDRNAPFTAADSNTISVDAGLGARPLDMMGMIFFIVIAGILLSIFGCILRRYFKMCLQRRRERLGKEKYMREIEGCHVVDFSGERWRQED